MLHFVVASLLDTPMTAEDQLARLRAIADALPDPVFVLDDAGRYLDVFGGTARELYDSSRFLIGRTLHDVLPAAQAERFLATIRAALEAGRPLVQEYTLDSEQVAGSAQDGPSGLQWFEARVAPIGDGGQGQVVWTAVNISARKRLEQELKDAAVTDPLTGVGNRRLFVQLLEKELKRQQRQPRPLALLLLDLDHFKRINDSFGHAAGDAVLRKVSRRLSGALRGSDTLCRIGGEEFGILLCDAGAPMSLAERLCRCLADKPFGLPHGPLWLTVSGGLSVYRDGDDADAIMGRADRALYEAKAAGRDRVVAADGDAELIRGD